MKEPDVFDYEDMDDFIADSKHYDFIKQCKNKMNKKFYLSWVWNPLFWTIEKTRRFNGGNPYDCYRFGPLFLRVYL